MGPSRFTFDRVSFFVVFLGVPLVVFVVFVVSPFVQAIYFSLTDWSGFNPNLNFVGLDNYRRLFADQRFLKSMRNSLLLGLIVPLATIAFALILAYLVTVGGGGAGTIRGLRRSGAYRIVSFFPHIIPGIVIGIIWAQVYDPQAGLLNSLLTSSGLDGFEHFAWLGDVRTAMPASMFVIIWSFVGFYMVLFIAAIRGIDPELFDAARIDGAGRVRTIVHIILPLIRDNVQTAYIHIGAVALDAFIYMAALNSTGGPENSTLVMSQELFMTAFTKGQFGYATAMGVMLALVTLLFASLLFALNLVSARRIKKVSA